MLTSFCRRKALRCRSSSRSSLRALLGVSEGVLQGAENQRERRAKLVADIREEGGLRTIEFGQCVGAASLGLVGVCVLHG